MTVSNAVKYSTFESSSKVAHPLDQAGLFSKLFFSWANPLVALGNDRQLRPDDLWDLQDSNSVAYRLAIFQKAYEKHNKNILRAFFAIYWPQFILIGVMKLFVAIAALYGPGYILSEIVKLVQSPTFDETRGWHLVLSLFLIQFINSFVVVHLQYISDMVSMQFMGCLRSMLFEKALKLNATSKKLKTAGDITNLVSTDAINAMRFAPNAHQFWIVPLQVSVVLYLLYTFVGWSIFVGLGGVVVILILNAIFVIRIGKQQRELSTLRDDRMRAINELFGAIQIVKFNAWEDKFKAKVSELRANEVKALWGFFYNYFFLITSFYATPSIITFIVFTTFTLWMNQLLTVRIVFSTLALFKSLQEALVLLPMALTALIQALVSANRINEFLLLGEHDPANISVPTTDPTLAKKYAAEGVVVAIDNGSFSWSTDDEIPYFQNIKMSIRQGELVVLHGAVGQGKSSLCSVLLGDMIKTLGSVFVGGSVAYFAQQPWIQHTSIRENILFGRPYDRVKYQRVIEACALVKDIASFPAGDRSEIGPKGLNLSGGQKARVALARACYSEADILILDSPLSAVDAIVATEIFTKCLLGLLRNKTVLLVTHNPEIISSPGVDRTILIQDGQLIVSTGETSGAKRAELMTDMEPFLGRPAYWNDDDVVENTQRSDGLTKLNNMLLTPTVRTPYGANTVDYLFTPQDEVSVAKHFDEAGRLVEEEERAEGRVSMKVVKAYLGAMGGWQAVVVISLATLSYIGLRLASDLWLTKWSNSSETMDAATFEANTPLNISVYGAVGIASCIMMGLDVYATTTYCVRGSQSLFHAMLSGLLRAPMRFFDVNPIGRILNRFSDDIRACDFGISFSLLSMMLELFGVVFNIGTTIILMQWLGFAVIPLIYIYLRLGSYFIEPLREVNRIQQTTRSPIISLVSEGIDGATTIRAYGSKQIRRFHRLQERNIETYCTAWFAQTIANQWFTLRVELISCSIVGLVLISIVLFHGSLSHGFVGLLITYALSIPESLKNLVDVWSSLETAIISPERLYQYINVEEEGARRGNADSSVWPTTGQITFKNVSFRYKPNDPLVLKHINFTIRGGEKIGIVGRTGAGKSSLMMALFRINEVAEGSIEIDGISTATIGLEKLRSNLAIIPQSPVLFKGTLRNYLDPFNEFSDDQLWNVLSKVQLMDRLGTVDDKLNSPVEENGENFSVGERQMLCMARALLRQAKIVVLDEATAAIDQKTDQILQRVIREEFATSTVLTIAHRLDTVLDCDRIMVFDHGELVQADAPHVLIGRGTGIFFDLVSEGGYTEKIIAIEKEVE